MKRALLPLVLAVAFSSPSLPARARTEADHTEPGAGHGPAAPATGNSDHGGLAARFNEITRRVLTTGSFRATARLLDGRAHFNALHAAHPGHAGIPTHRLTVDFSARFRGKRPPAAAALEIVAPSREVTETSFWREDGLVVADLELAGTGSYGFRLSVEEGASRRTLSWKETLT